MWQGRVRLCCNLGRAGQGQLLFPPELARQRACCLPNGPGSSAPNCVTSTGAEGCRNERAAVAAARSVFAAHPGQVKPATWQGRMLTCQCVVPVCAQAAAWDAGGGVCQPAPCSRPLLQHLLQGGGSCRCVLVCDGGGGVAGEPRWLLQVGHCSQLARKKQQGKWACSMTEVRPQVGGHCNCHTQAGTCGHCASAWRREASRVLQLLRVC